MLCLTGYTQANSECDLPIPSITGNIQVCEKDVETYTVEDYTATSTYTWTYQHNRGNAIISTGNSLSIDFTGVYYSPTEITLSETSIDGCTKETNLTVSVNENPFFLIMGPLDGCANATENYFVSTDTTYQFWLKIICVPLYN